MELFVDISLVTEHNQRGHLHTVKRSVSRGTGGCLNLGEILRRNKKGPLNPGGMNVQVYCHLFHVKAGRCGLLGSTGC